MKQSLTATNRRIFIGSETDNFQIFSITQNRNDGSIYFSAPEFEEISWIVPEIGEDQQPAVLSYQSDGQGKLSLHGSGVTHVRPHGSSRANEFSIRGNELMNKDGERLGARHLMTIFLSEPKHRAGSPALARQSDCIISTTQWSPVVVVFWAVPATRPITVKIKGSFHVDDMEEDPPNGGFGAFTMTHHAIVWFAYQTKHMDRWPFNSQACYSDGHTVPLFIGAGTGQMVLEGRQPTYSLIDNILTIEF